MNFNEYQEQARATDQHPARGGDGIVIPLMGLVGEVGTLHSEYKKKLRDGDAHRFFVDVVEEELGDILWYTANLATKLGRNLDEIARRNLEKTRSRWVAPDLSQSAVLDATWPVHEQLPRRLVVDITERDDGDRTIVTLTTADGRQVGNELTDNAHIDDGYRFHDVFHLANMAVLGWSPVMRRNLDCKRHSDPRVDEVEDGGRAIVTEEGIASYVFDRARHRQFFDGVHRIDFEILDTIKSLTATFEVRDRSHAEWEYTLLSAYEVWREVRRNGGGLVVADMTARRLEYAAR